MCSCKFTVVAVQVHGLFRTSWLISRHIPRPDQRLHCWSCFDNIPMVGCRGLVVCSLWWLCCHRSSCNTNRCAAPFRVGLSVHKHSRCYGYTNKQADKQIEHVSSPCKFWQCTFCCVPVCMFVYVIEWLCFWVGSRSNRVHSLTFTGNPL